jgi:hypothetical protein
MKLSGREGNGRWRRPQAGEMAEWLKALVC